MRAPEGRSVEGRGCCVAAKTEGVKARERSGGRHVPRHAGSVARREALLGEGEKQHGGNAITQGECEINVFEKGHPLVVSHWPTRETHIVEKLQRAAAARLWRLCHKVAFV